MGEIGILNVGAGDNKLVFDKSDPAGMIRAARIVTDMLRRGYALLVEIEVNGEKRFQRIKEFDESKAEYIIADFDPVAAAAADQSEVEAKADSGYEAEYEEAQGTTEAAVEPTSKAGHPRGRQTKSKLKDRRIPAESTRAVAVARTAGG